jgi:tyrosyl-tRNA synthetase
VYAVTIPLIVDKVTGKKLGKSEGNSVWLDAEKTSPFAFYQFWLNVSDENVIDYLKIFTMLNLEEIETINIEQQSEPGARTAQKRLAFEVTQIVHKEAAATIATNVSETIFGSRTLHEMSAQERAVLIENAPISNVELGVSIVDVLVETGLATSKREARTFVESGAVSVNAVKLVETTDILSEHLFTDGLAVLRRGKKHVHILKI